MEKKTESLKQLSVVEGFLHPPVCCYTDDTNQISRSWSSALCFSFSGCPAGDSRISLEVESMHNDI